MNSNKLIDEKGTSSDADNPANNLTAPLPMNFGTAGEEFTDADTAGNTAGQSSKDVRSDQTYFMNSNSTTVTFPLSDDEDKVAALSAPASTSDDLTAEYEALKNKVADLAAREEKTRKQLHVLTMFKDDHPELFEKWQAKEVADRDVVTASRKAHEEKTGRLQAEMKAQLADLESQLVMR